MIVGGSQRASGSCRVCGNEAGNRAHQAREMMFGLRDAFRYLECAACGTLALETPPPDLAKYYPPNYYSFQPRTGIYGFAKARQARHSFGQPDLIGRLVAMFLGPEGSVAALKQIQPPLQARILDVGSGSGAFLQTLAGLGFVSLYGIDPFLPEAEVRGRGFLIERKSLAQTEGVFDVITLNHVFEHMPDPLPTLQEIRRHLAPRGIALIRIPVADCFAWRRFGVNWVQLDCPRHLFLHTRRGMELLAGKAGLQVVRTMHDSTSFQLWGSRLYEKDIPLASPRSPLGSRWGLLMHLPRMLADSGRARVLNAEGAGDSACFYLGPSEG
jgi:SAM-dependent methyltransferase